MKTALIIIVILVVLGGGYWWYTNQTTPVTTEDMTSTTPETNNPQTGNSNGIGVEADVSVTVPQVKAFTVSGENFAFSPATLSVKKGDTVRITFKNTGGKHDLVIDEFDTRTKILDNGAEETIEFVASKAGTFEYYCSVGSHRQMGMKGTLSVTE